MRKIKQKKHKEYEVSSETESKIIATVVELYKFNTTFSRMLQKLSEEDQPRFLNKYQYFSKKIIELANSIDVQVNDFCGFDFDPGLPVSILNLEDYDIEDELIISQMLEPAIMKDGKLVKMGVALVSKKPKEDNNT